MISLLIAVVYTLTLLSPVIRLLSMTVLLSLVMLTPITRSLRVPYGIAVILCYGLVILILVIALFLFIPELVNGSTIWGRLLSSATVNWKTLYRTIHRIKVS